MQNAKETLEQRVQERTAAVWQVNKKLTSEIIKRQQTYADLNESEERYRNLLGNANDLIQKVTSDGYFVYVNRASLGISTT